MVFARVRRDNDEHRRTHDSPRGCRCTTNGAAPIRRSPSFARTCTTVSEAFQAGGPVPSDTTVAALARALKLLVDELVLPQPGRRRVAAGPADQ